MFMTKFFNKIIKPYFWPIFPIFGVKNFFQKIWLCQAQLQMGFKKLSKNYWFNSKNNARMKKWMDGQADPIL